MLYRKYAACHICNMENFDTMLFVKALGLAVAMEGMLWAGFPGRMREAARQASQLSTATLRAIGSIMLVAGVFVCALGF